jgi:hypothetical protein
MNLKAQSFCKLDGLMKQLMPYLENGSWGMREAGGGREARGAENQQNSKLS